MRTIRDARGFTLVEVLVALVIVSLGMAALLGTLNSAAGTAGYLQDKTLAEWIALNQISKVRLNSQGPSKGDSDGEVDYAGRKWKWTQNVDVMPIPGVLKINVKVRPSDSTAGSDEAWYADVIGVYGDAVGAPRGDLPSWSTAPGQNNANNNNSNTPGSPTTPGAATQSTGPNNTPLTPFNPSTPNPVQQTPTVPNR
ncbi:MAG TPA: type II secretion system minor pseudopilin GspI [Steroidobacteraceae bacterium]